MRAYCGYKLERNKQNRTETSKILTNLTSESNLSAFLHSGFYRYKIQETQKYIFIIFLHAGETRWTR